MPELKPARILKFRPSLNKIASIVNETYAAKGEAATVRDDDALCRIRDLIDEDDLDAEQLLTLLFTAMKPLEEIHMLLATYKYKKENTSHGKDCESNN